MKTLALIPARGGSKGIPRKNLKMLEGKPLIAWSIEAALRSSAVDTVMVSTDDEEIRDVARGCGAEVPFLRPPALATDDASVIDSVLHVLNACPAFDAVVLLQPTSPLRTTDDIDACVAVAHARQAPAAVSVSAAGTHPIWMYSVGPDQRMQPLLDHPTPATRQALPPVYALNGAVYYANADWLQRSRTFVTAETVAYVMPFERSIDIDTALDWTIAEGLLKERL